MLRILLTLSAFSLLVSDALAFNSSGHAVIGLIAYDSMAPAARTAVVEMLRHHPRFDEHFLARMPEAVSNGTEREQERWLFAYAGTWSDVVKSDQLPTADSERFNRPVWHYVNFPTFLTVRDRAAMEPTLTVNLATEPTVDRDDFNMNVVQAFKNSLRIVKDPKSSVEDKAVHLCWIFHLAGDSHQPCHSTALFTLGRFHSGDRGANEVKTNPGNNLHSVWDKMILSSGHLSRVGDYNDMRRKAVELSNRKAFAGGTIEDWIRESWQLASTEVYSPGIRKYVQSREHQGEFGAVGLPKEYFKRGAQVCELRAVQSGKRLSAVLETVVKRR